MRKTILRLLLLVVAVAVMAGCVLIGRGYQMYQAALTQQSLESKVAEIQSDSSYTELSELPKMYLNAVVAVEDHRFEQHFGIDLIAIGRAAWNNLTTWSLREGGSTITQQLAKNTYFTQEKSFIRIGCAFCEGENFNCLLKTILIGFIIFQTTSRFWRDMVWNGSQSLKFKTGARRLLFICAALARMVRKTVYLWKHSNNGCEHMICLLLIVLL